MPDYLYENNARVKGFNNICGIVGRRASFKGVPFNNSFPLNNETILRNSYKRPK